MWAVGNGEGCFSGASRPIHIPQLCLVFTGREEYSLSDPRAKLSERISEFKNVFSEIVDSCLHAIPGMLSYCDRYSEGMKHVLKTFGPIPEFSRATAEKVNQVRRLTVEKHVGHLQHLPPLTSAVGGRASAAGILALDLSVSSFITLFMLPSCHQDTLRTG